MLTFYTGLEVEAEACGLDVGVGDEAKEGVAVRGVKGADFSVCIAKRC